MELRRCGQARHQAVALPPFRVLGSVIVVLGWPVFTLSPVLQSPFPQAGGPTVGLWSESGQPEPFCGLER